MFMELVPTNTLPQKHKDALAEGGGDSGLKVQAESSQGAKLSFRDLTQCESATRVCGLAEQILHPQNTLSIASEKYSKHGDLYV